MPIGNTGSVAGPMPTAAQSGADATDDATTGAAAKAGNNASGNAAANANANKATPEELARKIVDFLVDQDMDEAGTIILDRAQLHALAEGDQEMEDVLFLVFRMLAALATTMNSSLKNQLDSSQAIRNKLIEINDLNKDLQKWQPTSTNTTDTGKLGGESLAEANRVLALLHKYGVATDVPDGAQNDPNLLFGPDSNRDFDGAKYNGWISQLGTVRDNTQTQTQQLQLTLQNLIGIATKLIEASSSVQGKNFQLSDTIARNFLQ